MNKNIQIIISSKLKAQGLKLLAFNFKLLAFSFLLLAFSFQLLANVVFAGPQSATYELKEYGFGSGGENGLSSSSYSLFGTLGETDTASASSTSFALGAGLISTLQAAVPPAPTVTNPGSTYDRLLVTIQTGGNPTDTHYAISISDGTTTRYIQNDRTMGTILAAEDWLPYTGAITVGWGGGSGFYVTGLKNNTTYTVRVKAEQGIYTESGWGPAANQATTDPTFTFGVNASSISFSNLNAGNSYTDAGQSTVLTTSTNAYNGYLVYGYETQPLTHSVNASYTIADYSGINSAPTSWINTGFGYSTSDSTLVGGVANRFTNGGPNYAKFTTSTPGDPVADHPGPILSPIANEQFTVSYRVTADNTTPAGQYKTTVIYTAVPMY